MSDEEKWETCPGCGLCRRPSPQSIRWTSEPPNKRLLNHFAAAIREAKP